MKTFFLGLSVSLLLSTFGQADTAIRFSEVVPPAQTGASKMEFRSGETVTVLNVKNEAIITDKDVEKAEALPGDSGLLLILTPKGDAAFNQAVDKLQGQCLAIVIDGKLRSNFFLRGKNFGNKITVVGNLTAEEIKTLVADLNRRS